MPSAIHSGSRQNDRFLPYRVCETTTRFDEIQPAVREYKRQIALCNDLSLYTQFVAYLRDNPRLLVRPVKDLYAPAPADVVPVALRHDIDTDPWSALELSRTLRTAGLSGSFYVLPTAAYYGRFHSGGFERYTGLPALLRAIQDECLCEVGLHVDGLGVYQLYKTDGTQSVRTELSWLREQGLRITGTAAHNSAPAYGAENFELFKGRALYGRTTLCRNGLSIPLQSLSETTLGLDYEANHPEIDQTRDSPELQRYLSETPPDAVRNERWMQTYLVENPYARWGHDYNIWLIGRDRWSIGGHRKRDPVFKWNMRFRDVCTFLDNVPAGKHVVCHIHPVYIYQSTEQVAAA